MLFLAAFAVFSVFAQSLLGSAQLDRWLQTTDNTDSTTDLTTVTYIDGVYRRDDPCPQGWIPVLTWCYRALPISTTRSWSASMAACQSLSMNAVLAPVGAPWESEAIRAVSGIMPGQRLWHGCAVDSSPANPSFGDVMLTDASSSKWTQWGGSAYSPSAWAPGSTCFMDSSGLWGLSPGGAVDGSNAYGAVCAMRAFSKDPANSACTAGWRYVRNQAANQANTPSYCYTYFPELRDFATAKAACSEVGADVARLEVTCSPGTYIRSLAVDLGRAMGTAAHLETLRRTRTGGFDVADAVPLETLLERGEVEEHWRSIPDCLPHWPRRIVDGEELVRVLNGGDVSYEGAPDPGPVFIVDVDGRAIAVAEVEEGEGGPRLMVRRLLVDTTPSS